MAIKGGFDANDIAAQILSALDAVEDTGVKKAEDIGVSIGQAVRDGIVEGSKGLESEIGKTYKQFQNFVRSMNRSADGLKLDKWKKGLGLAESLMKDEKYARRVADALKDVQATFNGTKVIGLENVLKEFAKNSKALQGVSVPQVKSGGAKTSNKPKVETPVVQADPVPVVKKEAKQVEELEQRYRSLIQAMQEWKKLSEDVKSIKQFKNAADLRKQVFTLLSQISSDTAHIIGPGFGDALARGFKNIPTKDILAQIGWIDNANMLDDITKQLNVLSSINLKNFNLSEILSLYDNSRTSSTHQLREFYDILKQIAQIQGQMDSPVSAATDAIEAQGEAIEQTVKQMPKMESIIKRYNKLMHELGLEHLTIGEQLSQGTDGWGLNEMVKEAKSQLDRMLYFDGEQPDESWSKEATKRWKSETGKLQRFIAAYEPYVDVTTTTVGDVQQVTTVTEKQTEALQKQADAAEKAAQAQEKLNDQMQEAKNIGYHAGDLGKAESYGHFAYGRRDTGHFGTGTYFVGNQKAIENYNWRDGKPAPIETVDFGKYHLFKPEDTEQAYELHAALKQINDDLLYMHQYDDVDLKFLRDAIDNGNMEPISQFLGKYLTDEARSHYENEALEYKSYLDSANRDSVRKEIESSYDEINKDFGDSIDDLYLIDDELLDQEVQWRLDEIKALRENFNLDEEIAKRVAYDIEHGKFESISEMQGLKDNLVDRLAKIFVNSSREELSEALEETFRTISKYPEGSFYKVDNASTVFMKKLGYEGIDTRHTDLDNSAFGSVIYDLKDEDLARRQEILRIAKQAAEVKKQEAQQKMVKTSELLGKLYEKFDQNQFKEIFGDVEKSFGALSVDNAEAIYDALIAKEQEYYNEIRRRAEATANLTKLVNEQFNDYAGIEEFRNKFMALLSDIMEGRTTFEEASGALKEFTNTLSINAAEQEMEQFVAKCKEIQNQEVFDNIDCDKLLSDLETAYSKLMKLKEEGKIVFGAHDPEWEFEAAKSQLEYQKRVAEAAKEGIVYHAGVLGNVGRTIKSRPLGSVVPEKHGDYNSLTGLYTTPDWDGFIGNEWSGAPISTIDINQYKLFDARRKSIALQAHQFFDNLNGTIYGYQEYFDNEAQEMAKTTNVKSIESLYEEFKSVFVNAEMSFEQFAAFIKESAAIVKGHDFKPIDYVDIDEGIGKSYSTSALQGVSKEIFDSDSFSTRLMKMLGYEGLDTRGSGLDSTYKGGTVIFDVKPESIISTDGKWSELMSRHGVELDEKSLENEERRRQLAFDTAKAYSRQEDSATKISEADAKVKLTAIQRQAYNYRRPTDNDKALAERELTLTEKLSEIESIKKEFPELEKACISAEKAVSKTLDTLHRVNVDTNDESVSNELKDTFDIIQQGESVTAKFETTANTVHEALRKMRDALPEDRQAWGTYIDKMLASGDDKAIDTFKSISGSIGDHSELYKMENLGDGRVAVTFSGMHDKLIEGENKYQQELEETARIQKERDEQLGAFADAAIPLFGDDRYRSVAFEDKNHLFESFADKITEDGMSASDAMDQLYLSMEALRKQGEAMPDNIGVDYSAEIQKLEAHVNNLGEEFKSSEQYRDNFSMLVDGIKSGSISAAQAMEKMSDAYEKWSTELVGSEPKEDKNLLDIVANKNDPRVAKAFKGMDIKKWINGNVQKDARDELEGELYKLAQTIVDDNSEAYNAQLSHIADFIVANFKSRERKDADPYDDIFESVNIAYTNEDAAAMGEQLFEDAKRILKNKFKKRTEKNKNAQSVDQFIKGLITDGQTSLFSDPHGQEADEDKFREFLNHYESWAQGNKRKTRDVSLSDSDAPGIIENFNETMRDQMVANIEEQQAILDAKTEAAQAATDNLDKAFQNVKSASSRAVLKGQTKADFEDFARQIANDSGMELGTVAVSRDEMDQMRIASIKLLNKELAQSITYTYDIQENAEGVNEAFLRSSYAVGDANKALENARKKEEQDAKKKLQNDTWLYAQRGKLDTQQRRYTDPDRGVDGKLSIMSTETSLADDAEHTIESLANHIRKNIKKSLSDGLTDEVKRKIISDLEILENEIKVRQSETYSSTTMKSSQFETNKKAYQEYMKAFTARAQKSGVFSQMAKTINDLNTELNSVSDAKGFSQFVDNFKIARNKLQAETAALARDTKVLQTQLSALKGEENAYGKISANVRSIGPDNLGDSFKQKIASYESALRDLRAAMDALKSDPIDASGNLHRAFDDAALKAKNARVEIEGIFKQSQKLDQVMANMEVFDKKKLDPSELKNLQQAMLSFASSVEDGVFKFKGFNKAGTEMYGTLEQSSGAIKNVTVALKQSSDQLFMYGTNANRADNEWEEFKNTLASGTKNLVGMYVGFQEGVQAIRSGVEAVKQIDLAMTELKKVTDETDDSYREFLEDAGRTSAVIGSTVSDFAEASATFARLGYSLDEASSMAETAIVYKNVADGLDTVEEASDSIISTMMAFGIEASDTMGIIDRFNAVGNNFAITSAGIGDALQRSASALFEAGNTIDESIALVTAAM